MLYASLEWASRGVYKAFDGLEMTSKRREKYWFLCMFVGVQLVRFGDFVYWVVEA
jgi:hypothetical protein